MAIKSKGRTRGRRAVAAAPRRALVTRKPPIWRRRWVWAVVALAAVGGILAGVFSVLHAHGVKARTERETVAVRALLNQLRAKLPDDRRAVPPDVVQIFPSVTTDLPKIGKEIKGEAAAKRGREITDQAKKSFDELQAIQLRQIDRLVPAEFSTDRSSLKDAMFLISRSVGLYQQVGALVQAAADLTRAEQKSILDQATALTQQAGALFDQGYREVLHITNRLGIPTTIPFNPPPPAPTPGPSATSSANPAPSASPSR
jgi:hypothetical protein